MTTPVRSKSVSAAFEARAQRAEGLANGSSAAVEPLQFVTGLFRVQGAVAAALESSHAAQPFSGRWSTDVETVFETTRDILRFAAWESPALLAEEARARVREDAETAKTRLTLYWRGDRASHDDYLSRAMFRPYVETLRALGITPDRPHDHGRCPHCGGAPIVGCRRGGAESEGAARSLVCGLCGLEWSFRRVLCPACFEDDPHKLPSFATDAHPSARIEACETCRRYVKSLDLSLDARPIPEVDDLLSIALDLWAVEQGFTRVEPGLAGV